MMTSALIPTAGTSGNTTATADANRAATTGKATTLIVCAANFKRREAMHPAKSARLEKDSNPERYCPHKQCLWKVARSGPCPKHPKYQQPMHCVSDNDPPEKWFRAMGWEYPEIGMTSKTMSVLTPEQIARVAAQKDPYDD